MTTQFFDPGRLRSRILTPDRRLRLLTPRSLWIAFGGLHLVFLVALLPTIIGGEVLGDLPLYRMWAQSGLVNNQWYGIDHQWVYPLGALIPITLAGLAGPVLYQLSWFLMTTILNGLAVGVLIGWGRDRRGFPAAWAWLLVTFLLSPVGLLRLEGITAPMVVIALTIIGRRPAVAAVLLATATWIKVWPAAVILAVVITSRHRITVLLTSTLVTVVVVFLSVLAGGAKYLDGFITAQSDRALQLEAPVTTLWVWMAALGDFRTVIYQNLAIETREVRGPGTGVTASLMTPLMFLAIVLIALVLCAALKRGAEPTDLLLTGSLALVGAFIVFNKVGSPQYMLWLMPIVTVGIAHNWERWRTPTFLLVAIALLTSLVFPVFYLPLVDGNLFAVTLLTARNALLVVLFVWSVGAIVGSGWPRRPATAVRGPQLPGYDTHAVVIRPEQPVRAGDKERRTLRRARR